MLLSVEIYFLHSWTLNHFSFLGCLCWGRQGECQRLSRHGVAAPLCAEQCRCVPGNRCSSGLAGNRLCRFGSFGTSEPCVQGGRSTLGLAEPLRYCIAAVRSGRGRRAVMSLLWSCCRRVERAAAAAADGIVFVVAAEWQTLPTKIPPWPLRSLLGVGVPPCQRSAMNPGCMLLFVFGFVGGAVVINSAILVSLSVLLLVHFSISTGVPALTQNLPRILRYSEPLNPLFVCSRCSSAFCSAFSNGLIREINYI